MNANSPGRQPSLSQANTPANSDSLHREKARLRRIGIVVLLIGFGIAGLIYWMGTRSEDSGLNEYQETLSRAETRQMQMLYGTSGGIMQDFLDALKRPRTQAITIAAVSGLVAAGCFYLGRPLPESEENP